MRGAWAPGVIWAPCPWCAACHVGMFLTTGRSGCGWVSDDQTRIQLQLPVCPAASPVLRAPTLAARENEGVGSRAEGGSLRLRCVTGLINEVSPSLLMTDTFYSCLRKVGNINLEDPLEVKVFIVRKRQRGFPTETLKTSGYLTGQHRPGEHHQLPLPCSCTEGTTAQTRCL